MEISENYDGKEEKEDIQINQMSHPVSRHVFGFCFSLSICVCDCMLTCDNKNRQINSERATEGEIHTQIEI